MRFIDTSRVRTRFDERVVMADGVELSVDVYLPPAPGIYPALLNRTPADNNRAGRTAISPPPAERWRTMAAQGYIVATADVRGRGDSDGQFIPFVHEANDGAATVAWLRRFEECNAQIGVFGSGYGAFCAWAAAIVDGHVDAIASISPFGAVGKGLVHRGGAVRLDWLFWMHLIAGRTVQPANVPPWTRVHQHLPLATLDEALGREDIWWQEWMNHLDDRHSFWASLNLSEKIAALRIPGLHVTGWWDGQAAAAHYYYEASCRSGTPQCLIVGPWHTAAVRRPSRQVGGFDFGPRSVMDLDETLIEFFSSCLRTNNAAQFMESRVFVTGRNEWVKCTTWPSNPVSNPQETLTLHASSVLGANTRRGDGILSSMPAEISGKDVITHNPLVPVEFQPRFVSFAAGANPLGLTLDQSHVTSRDEVLVYTSRVLERPITVYGRPKITFTLRTTAPDGDVFVLLSDTFPLGASDLHLGHAAIRLATLRKFKPRELVTVELELDMVAHDFQPGHQIRLTLSPSLFPLYARNLQISEYVSGKEPAIADIEFHHAPRMPILLTLPLADAAQIPMSSVAA